MRAYLQILQRHVLIALVYCSRVHLLGVREQIVIPDMVRMSVRVDDYLDVLGLDTLLGQC